MLTEKEIEEGNKLIDRFIGNKSNGNGRIYPLSHSRLNYHSSWNWLMPVVEKIEQSCMITFYSPLSLRNGKNSCRICPIPYNENTEIFIESEVKIEAIYKAVVQFIKWYNKTTK